MIALYCRVSTLDQKTDRQKVNEKEYGVLIEDRCSGSIPFFEREGGKKIIKLINKGVLTSLAVWSIDRLGRDLRDIINTIHFFTERKISIHFISQGLTTIDKNGKENAISKMMISILGVVGEMERNQIKERQREGIIIAKANGIIRAEPKAVRRMYTSFLSKERNRKALDMMKRGFKNVEISALTGLNLNTLTKIKRLGIVA